MDNLNVSTTVQTDSELDKDDFWRSALNVVKISTLLASILGLLGNFLSYGTANFMPRSNSSVLMKYLAVWDSVAVCLTGIIPGFADLVGFHFRLIGKVSKAFAEIIHAYMLNC